MLPEKALSERKGTVNPAELSLHVMHGCPSMWKREHEVAGMVARGLRNGKNLLDKNGNAKDLFDEWNR
jgi:hypothetical protein